MGATPSRQIWRYTRRRNDQEDRCAREQLSVAGLAEGERIEIVGDDPIFELGIREFCAARGCSIERSEINGREIRLELCIGGAKQES
jgi:hypothetical protein